MDTLSQTSEPKLRILLDRLQATVSAQCQIPDPRLSPEARLQRRLAFRNERALFQRKSDLSGKRIVSIFSADAPYTVYDQEEWWSDAWDGIQFGRDFDFSKTFTEQFKELCLQVPHISLFTSNVENSYYTNYTLNSRDCYLAYGTTNCDSCLYTKLVSNCTDVIDCYAVYSSELCYEGAASHGCYNCSYFQNCRHCSDCFAVEACQSSRNCAFCFGLYKGEYHWFNERVGKERFHRLMAELRQMSVVELSNLWQRFSDLKRKIPHPQSYIYGSEDCTGDGIFNSKGCHNCFDITDGEESDNIFCTPKASYSHDCTYNAPDGVQFSYNLCSSVGTSNSMCTFLSWYNDSVFYTMESHQSQNLFGCVGLRKKQYCIFNKQYDAISYEKLVSRIVSHMCETGEWGEYFAPELSYFGYNQTVAQEYFPLEKEAAARDGWNWSSEPSTPPHGEKMLAPQDRNLVSDDLSEQIFTCEVSGKSYRFNPLELKFYRSQQLFLPRLCPDERHARRLQRRGMPKLWKRTCAETGTVIYSIYPPNETVQVLDDKVFWKKRFD